MGRSGKSAAKKRRMLQISRADKEQHSKLRSEPSHSRKARARARSHNGRQEAQREKNDCPEGHGDLFAEGMRNTPEIAEKAMVPGRQNDFNGKRGVKSRQGLASGAGGWAGFAKEKRKTTARRNVAVVDSDVSGGSSDSDDKVARSDYANACGMHESNWEPLEWALNKEGVESEAEEELEWQLEHIRSGILLNSISVGESSLRDKHARIAKRRGKAERREERAALLEKYAAEMRKVVAAGSLDAPAAAAAAAAAPLEIVADDEGMMLKVLRLSEAFSLAASVKGTTVCLSYSRGHSRLPSPSEHACLLRALGGHASAQLPRSTRGRSCRRTHGGGGASDQKCGESSHRGLKRDDSSETERCRGRGRKRRFPVAFTSGGHMVPHSARKDVAADPEDGVHRGREEEGAGIGTGSEEVEGRQAGDEEVEGRRTGKGDGGEDQCMLRLQTYASTSKARVHERKRRLRTAEQGDVLGRQEEGQEEGVDPVVYGHFATRLMAKMGYKQGEGLGVRSDGIRAPIAVSKRPRKLGLGVHV